MQCIRLASVASVYQSLLRIWPVGRLGLPPCRRLANGDADLPSTLLRGEGKGEQRISRILSRAGVCSRREAEKRMHEGRVLVNGKQIVDPGAKAKSRDEILFDGRRVEAASRLRVFALYKPVGYIVENVRAARAGPPSAFRFLEQLADTDSSLPQHIAAIGRLDVSSEGLLLFTTSGLLKRFLELPSSAIPRTYRVRVRGRVSVDALKRMSRGVVIDGERFRGVEATVDGTTAARAHTWMTMTLREGKYREIRRLIYHLCDGAQVARLLRISYGPVRLWANAKPGNIRELSQSEVRDIVNALDASWRRRAAQTVSADDAPTRDSSAQPRSRKPRRSPTRPRSDT